MPIGGHTVPSRRFGEILHNVLAVPINLPQGELGPEVPLLALEPERILVALVALHGTGSKMVENGVSLTVPSADTLALAHSVLSTQPADRV